MSWLCNKCSEGHKILQVAGGSFSVPQKSIFFTEPTSLLFNAYWGPFPRNKNGGRVNDPLPLSRAKVKEGPICISAFSYAFMFLQAKLYLFTCMKTSGFQTEKLLVNFCVSRAYPNVLQVCHMFLRLGLFLKQGVGQAVMWNVSLYCTFPSPVSRNNQRSEARNGTANCELLALWVAQISHSGADWFHLKSGFLCWNSVRRKAISWIHPTQSCQLLRIFCIAAEGILLVSRF